MPSKSPAQHRLMTAVANNPVFAKKVGISPAVGRDFVAADEAQGIEGGKIKRRVKREARRSARSRDNAMSHRDFEEL